MCLKGKNFKDPNKDQNGIKNNPTFPDKFTTMRNYNNQEKF